ncbi:MAG: hypothetical protein RLZZ535_2756 [Cyanobacteriota bacterium]
MAIFYTNAGARKKFELNPSNFLEGYELTVEERNSLMNMDWPGLTLAGNGFGYKRWKANQWRCAEAYLFTSYNDVFTSSHLDSVSLLFKNKIDNEKVKHEKLHATHAGIVGHLLKVPPENQINYEHVLFEDESLQSVTAVWRRLCELNLHNHYLIRAYLHRATKDTFNSPEILHSRPGVYISYVPLTSSDKNYYVTALLNNGDIICKEPLLYGRVITFPADVTQRIECDDGANDLPHTLDMLCIKTLCAAV